MFGLFSRHWRGAIGVWVGLAFSLILPVAMFFVMIYSQAYLELDRGPYARMAGATGGAIFSTLAAIWLLVGNWRTASKSISPRRWFVTRWLSRIVALAGAAATCLPWLYIAPQAVTNMQAILKDQDYVGQKPAYTLDVNGDELAVTGWVTWSLQDALVKALDDNPGVRTLVLNGPGGNAAVGLRMSNLIRSRQLDTMTTRFCASSCTIMFAGGHRRLIQKGARLAYHELFATFKTTSGGWNPMIDLLESRYRDVWRAEGVPSDFIDHVFRTPSDQVWTPAAEELLAANVVTDVVD